MIDINDFKIIFNNIPDAKTTMVEALYQQWLY